MSVRVRFAPSPTGHLHVGNARTALFNWLLARGRGGVCVLRIEDTDTERSTSESEHAIVDDLRWLGLSWDEGPEAGGAYGPYRQSERFETYREAARQLIDAGHAYYCFCTPVRIEAERAAARAEGRPPKYSGRCRGIPTEDAVRRREGGEPAAVRFAVPAGRTVTFEDAVRGTVSVHTDVIGDPVILRSDGRPAYNFSVVVDDAAMRITHVVRGEDHVSNTSRQVLIYEALGAPLPQFAHLALVLGPDHAPLSKRHGATSVAEFRERGFLPESLVNYLALLGWSPGNDEEIVPVEEMARRFDLADVGQSAAVFDPDKLAWLNRHYMKVADPVRLTRESLRYFARAGYVLHATDVSVGFVESLLPVAVGSVDRMDEIPSRLAFVFDWRVEAAAELVRRDGGAAVVAAFAAHAAGAGALDRERFRELTGAVRQDTGAKGKALFHPLRAALTGADSGPELDLAIPAIDRGAALPASAGVVPISSCAERARQVAEVIG